MTCPLRLRNSSAVLITYLILLFVAFVPKEGGTARDNSQSRPKYETELFRKRYKLDDRESLLAYIKALEAEIERSKREEPLGEAHKKDPVRHKEPRNHIDKKTLKSMEETRIVAIELSNATGGSRNELLEDLRVMAGAIRATFIRVLPPTMDFCQAFQKQSILRHPPVGLGKQGGASNLSSVTSDPSQADPVLPSGYWNKPSSIADKDLYYGFGRDTLPDLDGIVCEYRGSKQSRGVNPGFDAKCGQYSKAKLKFAEEFSQPFANRLYWALGYNTVPCDYVRTVKVKWDRRIFTEFNTRKNESFSINLLGIPIYKHRLQLYKDPLGPVSEVIMLDEQGREISVKPYPNWDEFKKKLYKNPQAHPLEVDSNFNVEFANRIQYLIYRGVNFRLDEDDVIGDKEIFLGNWDWNGEDNPELRENRGFVLMCAWLNQYDPWVHNNKLYMEKKKDRRAFKYYTTDLGGCLGPAHDTAKMIPQSPNQFPWSFTHEAREGEMSIPLDGSFHTTRVNETFKRADINDAKWMSRYMSQITSRQILDALVASGMPSAYVRVFYNKLVHRRNKAFADLELDYPPLELMDASQTFDYDPQKDGLISITTRHNGKITAPDDGWVVIKGRVYTRSQALKLQK